MKLKVFEIKAMLSIRLHPNFIFVISPDYRDDEIPFYPDA